MNENFTLKKIFSIIWIILIVRHVEDDEKITQQKFEICLLQHQKIISFRAICISKECYEETQISVFQMKESLNVIFTPSFAVDKENKSSNFYFWAPRIDTSLNDFLNDDDIFFVKITLSILYNRYKFLSYSLISLNFKNIL